MYSLMTVSKLQAELRRRNASTTGKKANLIERFSTRPKGQLLYDSRHLLTARYSSDGTYTYLRGQCKARIKNVAYQVDATVTQEGVIEECHCECAAGSGTSANCKHVAVLLLGVHDSVKNKIIKLHQACTLRASNFI